MSLDVWALLLGPTHASPCLYLQGLRVLGLATRAFAKPQAAFSTADECDLLFRGFLAFLDPPKPSAAAAVTVLAGRGIAIKVWGWQGRGRCSWEEPGRHMALGGENRMRCVRLGPLRHVQ